MNLENDDIDIEEVLYRYFRKELSQKDQEAVDSWREEGPGNQQKFDDLRIQFLDFKGLAYYQKTTNQVDQSWEQFASANKVKSIVSASPSLSPFLKYAASVLIVISTAFAIYHLQTQPLTVRLASAQSTREVSLPDNSLILLNQGASISYVAPFQNNERRVELSGDAYFEVSKDKEQAFVVEAAGAEIRVLGTKFYVQQTNNESLIVQVEEGKILVSYNDLHKIVAAGSAVKVDSDRNELLEEVDKTGLSTFWKNRKLIFNLTSIEEVVNSINTAYNVDIQLEGKTEGCSLTVVFDNESIETVLEIISSTLNYEIIESQGRFTLKGNGCR
ncbi:MAG: FecR domain-containing protein [Bacteroidota bacterium]